MGMIERTSRVKRHFGGSGSSVVVYDPAVLDLTAWYEASYANPWTPKASAGISGVNGNLDGAANPSVGAAVNGFTPAVFNGTTQYAPGATAASTDLVSASRFSMVVLAYITATVARDADYYQDQCLFTDDTGNFALAVNTSGLRVGVWTGASKQTTEVAQATGAWFMGAAVLNSNTLSCSVNAGAPATVATGGNFSLSPNRTFWAGKSWNGGAHFSGKILSIMTSKQDLSASLTDIRSYYNNRYGLSLA